MKWAAWIFIASLVCCVILCTEGETKNNYENYENVCGNHWQMKFKKLQTSILNRELPGRYIVSIPVKAGLADMILGYVSALLWSILTDRAYILLRIDDMGHCNQRTIEFSHHPGEIDWRPESADMSFDSSTYSCLMLPYSGKSDCKVKILLRKGDTKESLLKPMFQVNGGYKEAFLNLNMTEFPFDSFTNDVFMFLSNRGVTHNVFDNSNHKDTLLELGFKRTTIFPCLFNFMFQMNADVCEGKCKDVEARLLAALKEDSDTITIGVQVRDQFANTAVEHFYCADSLVSYYQGQGKKVLIVLVTSSHGLQISMKEQYGDMLLLPNVDPTPVISVHDRPGTESNDEAPSEEVCTERREHDRMGIMDSARDMYILSLTHMQIISRDSGFGVVGGMMRPREKPIMYRMALNEARPRMCNRTLGGDSLAVFANSWSGL